MTLDPVVATADRPDSPFVGDDVGAIDEGCPDPEPSDFEQTITDTEELRWFGVGPLPEASNDWFTRAGTGGAVEVRCDTYRLDGRPDLGVKRRFRETLELKLRRLVLEPALSLAPGLAGPLEVWRRWSPADEIPGSADEHAWVDVHKTVMKRRFSPEGIELPVSDELPSGGGCDVELVSIVVDHVDSWSFALAAYGPDGSGRSAMVTAWQALVSGAACPEGFVSALGEPSSYPKWLAEIASRETVTTVEGTARTPAP